MLVTPIAWGLSEGGNVIHPDSEPIFYGVLDIFAKVVFGVVVLFGLRTAAPEALGMHVQDSKAWSGAGQSMAENLNYQNHMAGSLGDKRDNHTHENNGPAADGSAV